MTLDEIIADLKFSGFDVFYSRRDRGYYWSYYDRETSTEFFDTEDDAWLDAWGDELPDCHK